MNAIEAVAYVRLQDTTRTLALCGRLSTPPIAAKALKRVAEELNIVVDLHMEENGHGKLYMKFGEMPFQNGYFPVKLDGTLDNFTMAPYTKDVTRRSPFFTNENVRVGH